MVQDKPKVASVPEKQLDADRWTPGHSVHCAICICCTCCTV